MQQCVNMYCVWKINFFLGIKIKLFSLSLQQKRITNLKHFLSKVQAYAWTSHYNPAETSTKALTWPPSSSPTSSAEELLSGRSTLLEGFPPVPCIVLSCMQTILQSSPSSSSSTSPSSSSSSSPGLSKLSSLSPKAQHDGRSGPHAPSCQYC